MSFLSRETGLRSGAPFQLLRVTVNSVDFFITSADQDLVYGGDTYEATDLQIVPPASGSGDDGVLTFTLPADHALALALAPTLVTEPSAVTLFDGHLGEAEVVTPFLGDVAFAERVGNRAVITCRSLASIEDRQLPTLAISRTCASMLYDTQLCKVDIDTFAYDAGTVTAISGRVVTVSGAATFAGADLAYFVNGVILKAGQPMGFIVAANGDDFTLLAPPPSSLMVTDAVRVAAGCDRTIGTCFGRFGNQRNAVLVPTSPARNPFRGRGLKP